MDLLKSLCISKYNSCHFFHASISSKLFAISLSNLLNSLIKTCYLKLVTRHYLTTKLIFHSIVGLSV